MEEVAELVDRVLARCPDITRTTADRAGILAGLEQAGASSLPALHALAVADYTGLKDAIGPAAKLAFAAMLKTEVLKASEPVRPARAAHGLLCPSLPRAKRERVAYTRRMSSERSSRA